MKVVMLGAGMMGSALCVPLAERGHEVHLVGTHLDGEIIEGLRRDHVHIKMGQKLPESIQAHPVEDFEAVARGVDVLALGVSSAGVAWAGEKIAPVVTEGLPILSISKGLEWDGEAFVLLPDVLKATWPQALREHVHPTAVVGPCIAGELARKVETCVSFVSRHRPTAVALADACHTDYYHVWPSDDLVGLEVCAALKNAYALAVGFGRGLNERHGFESGSVAMHNHEAGVFAQAAMEMAFMVELLGGNPIAALGMPGVGDLFVTCQGGRTSRLGRWLGLGLSMEDAIEKMAGATLESLDIIKVIGQALPALEAQGHLGAEDLPLMRHLIDIVRGEQGVSVPFKRFFQGR